MERLDPHLNDFAIRCFRDVADHDYIAARVAYRAELYGPFLWSSLQAIEKYLKGILLLNRVPARDLRHSLAKAIDRTSKLPFQISLCSGSQEFIRHIDKFGSFRYLESAYYVHGHLLPALDRAVFEIRRYCQPINFQITYPSGDTRNVLKLNLLRAEQAKHCSDVLLLGGKLEQILAKRDCPSRDALVWRNLWYSRARRRIVRSRQASLSVNAPLTLQPSLVDEVTKYVYLPKDVVSAYRAMAKEAR